MTDPISDQLPRKSDACNLMVFVLKNGEWVIRHTSNVKPGDTWAPIKPPPLPEPELLPCPFCGGTDIREEIHEGYIVGVCHTCGAKGPDARATFALVWQAAWNRRSPDARDELIRDYQKGKTKD